MQQQLTRLSFNYERLKQRITKTLFNQKKKKIKRKRKHHPMIQQKQKKEEIVKLMNISHHTSCQRIAGIL